MDSEEEDYHEDYEELFLGFSAKGFFFDHFDEKQTPEHFWWSASDIGEHPLQTSRKGWTEVLHQKGQMQFLGLLLTEMWEGVFHCWLIAKTESMYKPKGIPMSRLSQSLDQAEFLKPFLWPILCHTSSLSRHHTLNRWSHLSQCQLLTSCQCPLLAACQCPLLTVHQCPLLDTRQCLQPAARRCQSTR